jgi:putative FmdB family regulatory protein
VPTYQYQCTDCGEALEVHQSFTEDALTVCPACEGRLRKVFNAVGVVFKGSGFYRNDSRGTSSSSETSTSSSSGASKDTAPAKEKTSSTSTTTSGSSSSGGSAA